MIKTILQEDWIKKYKPHMEGDAVKTYETYGEELKFIKSVNPRNIWTMIAEGNSVFIESGYRWVNRLCYIVTEIPWEEGSYWDNAIIINWGYFEDEYLEDSIINQN